MKSAGRLITETLGYDGGRRVTVYVPPAAPSAVVFAGDGQLISRWGRDLDAADVPPTMIVGVHRADDEGSRLHEYSPGFDPERFAAHERFFVEDVRSWTRARFGVALAADRTAVCGVSAGGELALALGLRHPDTYGAMFSASPGAGYRPPDPLAQPLPRAYLVAGTLEPFFLENATRWANALRDAGGDIVVHERVAVARRSDVAGRAPPDDRLGVRRVTRTTAVVRSVVGAGPVPGARGGSRVLPSR